MKRMRTHILISAALVALALTATAATAQSKVDPKGSSATTSKQDPTSTRQAPPPSGKDAVGERGDRVKTGDTAESKPGAPGKPDEITGHGSDSKRQVIRKIMLEQSKYRKRTAKIKRLRALAAKQGNEQRLAALDKLQAKADELHARKITQWRAKLGDDEYRRVDDLIKKRKGKGKGKGKGKNEND